MSTDSEQIRQVFEEIYPQNVRTRNLESYGMMYTEQALWMPPNAPDRVGIPDIIDGFAAIIAIQDIEPTHTAEEIEVIGNIGYVVGVSIEVIYPHDGTPSRQAKYRVLWIMKKEGENWKIDRQIWNQKP